MKKQKLITAVLALVACMALLIAPMSVSAHAATPIKSSDPTEFTSIPYTGSVNFADADAADAGTWFIHDVKADQELEAFNVSEGLICAYYVNGEQVWTPFKVKTGDVLEVYVFSLSVGSYSFSLREKEIAPGYSPETALEIEDLNGSYGTAELAIDGHDVMYHKWTAARSGVIRLSFVTNSYDGQYFSSLVYANDLGFFASPLILEVEAGEEVIISTDTGAGWFAPGTVTIKIEQIQAVKLDESYSGYYQASGKSFKLNYAKKTISILDSNTSSDLNGSHSFTVTDSGVLKNDKFFLIAVQGDDGVQILFNGKEDSTLTVWENPEVTDTEILNYLTGSYNLMNPRKPSEIYRTYTFDYENRTVTVTGNKAGTYTFTLCPVDGTIDISEGDDLKIYLYDSGVIKKGSIYLKNTALEYIASHDYVEKVVEPTCTTEGYTSYTCSKCGDSYIDENSYVMPLGHNLETEIVAPTCTEQGYTIYTCTREGCYESNKDNYVDALGHSYNSVVTAPTCTEGGYTTNTCSACGDVTITDETAATGHNHQATVTEPTCTEPGYTTYTCACGDSYVGDQSNALGHAFGKWTNADAENHKKTCQRCGAEEKTAHIWDEGVVVKEPTEEVDGEKLLTCTECGATKTLAIPSLSHVHSYEAVVTAPTCTEQGYTTHTCRCGDTYKDTYVDALGHSYKDVVTAPTCTEGGYTTHTCTVCGHEVVDTKTNAKGHSYKDVVTKPTCTEGGYTTHTCTVCGHEVVDTKTNAKGHSYDNGVEGNGVITYTCTACGHSYQTEASNSEITVPGTISGLINGTQEFTWTATEDGYLIVDNISTISGVYHSVTINDAEAFPTDQGYAVVTGDVVVITITTYSEIEVNIPVSLNDGSQTPDVGGDAEMEFDIYWPAGSWDGYSSTWVAPKDGVYSFIIKSSNIPADGLTFTIVANNGSNWYSQYEFPLDADGNQYISLTVMAGEHLTIMAYDDAHTVAGELHIVVIEGEPAPHEHTWDAGVVTEPTCTAAGNTTYTCTVCGETKTEKIEKLSHTEEVIPGKEATCLETGLTEGVKCSACGTVLTEQTEIPVTEHSYGEWETVKEPTATETGSKKRVCANCGAEQTEEIPATGVTETQPATKPTQPATKPTQPATKPTQSATNPTQPATQPGGNSDGNNTVIILVIIAVVVVAGGAVAFVVIKKKK